MCVCVDGLSVDSAHDAVDGKDAPVTLYHFSVRTLRCRRIVTNVSDLEYQG